MVQAEAALPLRQNCGNSNGICGEPNAVLSVSVVDDFCNTLDLRMQTAWCCRDASVAENLPAKTMLPMRSRGSVAMERRAELSTTP
jgi:hypothetical protein